MTPDQRRRNRRTGLILAVIVIAIIAWSFVRGGFMTS
ncbi:MAG TPA: cytochrome oxidase small assembly protein [Eoetvoesiella sp.]